MLAARTPTRDLGLPPASQADVFLHALIGAYALMAHADGELAQSERRRLMAIVRDTPALDAVAAADVAALAADLEDGFRLDPEDARRRAWEKLDPIAGHRRAAHVVVAACCELIAADGIAHPAEYRALAAIKSRLGIDGLPPHA